MRSVGAWTLRRLSPAKSGRPPRDHRLNARSEIRRRAQGRRRAGAGPEITKAQALGTRDPGQVLGCPDEPMTEQVDCETKCPVAASSRSSLAVSKSKSSVPMPRPVQHCRHRLVARAMPAAAAAVRKDHQALGVGRISNRPPEPFSRNGFAMAGPAPAIPSATVPADARRSVIMA